MSLLDYFLVFYFRLSLFGKVFLQQRRSNLHLVTQESVVTLSFERYDQKNYKRTWLFVYSSSIESAVSRHFSPRLWKIW